MATLTIKNVSAADIYLSDLITTVAAGATLVADRASSDLPRMASLQKQLAAGNVTLSVTYTADEIASGLMAPPASVDWNDNVIVAATALPSNTFVIRKSFAAGGAAGSADDVTVYAVNTLPAKFRIIDAWAFISTAVGASTITVNDKAAVAGTTYAVIDSGSTGKGNWLTTTATGVVTPGAAFGLFLRRSDRSVVGEVFLLCRAES